MSTPNFGHLTKVDLRECWPREDSDFTPWLAGEENISLLGEAIGTELEVKEQEASVGSFSADILCRDVTNDSLVSLVVEHYESMDVEARGLVPLKKFYWPESE